jgi:hypothetical protein
MISKLNIDDYKTQTTMMIPATRLFTILTVPGYHSHIFQRAPGLSFLSTSIPRLMFLLFSLSLQKNSQTQ